MLIPISWLKEYTKVNLKLSDLMWKLTEIGLTCESYKRFGSDTVLDIETTPNRPDWMSVIGVAREIAALQRTSLKLPKLTKLPKSDNSLSLDFKHDFSLSPRFTAVIIKNILIKDSPKTIQNRLKSVGLRPINNIVDLTNYVMIETGSPIHAFDFDKIKGGVMELTLSKGGENFTSVDEKTYTLPKNSIIFKNNGQVIDLCGIKGGYNSGISSNTRNIMILVPVYNGAYVRRTSLTLGLSSDASKIFERGADAGSTLKTLVRITNLVLRYSGGNIASKIYDYKKDEIQNILLTLNISSIEKLLGIKIDTEKIIDILKYDYLSPQKKKDLICCTIPTYRRDLNIEVDLIEEIARFYGYNNIPKTIPKGLISTTDIPYKYQRKDELELKNIAVASGYNETVTLSLISNELIRKCNLNLDNHIKLINPISKEHEYLRNSLLPSLISAVKLNPDEKYLELFEYDKIYFINQNDYQEKYYLSFINLNGSFKKTKGDVDLFLRYYNLNNIKYRQTIIRNGIWHPNNSGLIEIKGETLLNFGEINPYVTNNFSIKEPLFALEIDVSVLTKHKSSKIFKNINPNPPQVEDLTLIIPKGIFYFDVVNSVIKTNYVNRVDLIDKYKNNYTIRINYQHPGKTLSNKEVDTIRKEIVSNLKKKYDIKLNN